MRLALATILVQAWLTSVAAASNCSLISNPNLRVVTPPTSVLDQGKTPNSAACSSFCAAARASYCQLQARPVGGGPIAGYTCSAFTGSMSVVTATTGVLRRPVVAGTCTDGCRVSSAEGKSIVNLGTETQSACAAVCKVQLAKVANSTCKWGANDIAPLGMCSITDFKGGHIFLNHGPKGACADRCAGLRPTHPRETCRWKATVLPSGA